MMKAKRIFAGMITAAMLTVMTPVPSFAASETIINPVVSERNTVTVSGTVPTPNSRVYIEIVRKDAEILDEDSVYFSRIITAGEDGGFSINCEMPEKDRKNTSDSIDGYFTVYVITAGTEDKTKDFSYVKTENLDTFFANLNLAAESNLRGFLNNRDNKIYFDLFNVPIDEFYAASEAKQVIMCNVLDGKVESYAKSNISEITDAIITSRLNSMSDAAAAKSIIESDEIFKQCNLVYGDDDYRTLDGTKKNWFYEVVLSYSEANKFTDAAQLNGIFAEAMVLYDVNRTHYSKLFDLLKANKGILNLTDLQTFKTLEDMTQDSASAVMQELKALSNSIKNTDSLAQLLKTAYDNYTAGLSSGSSGGSGSGGSGGNKNFSFNFTTGDNQQNTGNTGDDPKEYFVDLAGYEWAEEAVNALASDGIVSGDGNGNYNPERNVTRAEFVTMLMKAIDMVDENAVSEFEDVTEDSWCYKYVSSAYQMGIASGMSENMFGKDMEITRQEAAVFLHRACVRVYLPLDNELDERFADESEIASWALRSVNIMKAAGLINGVGDGSFNPLGVTTRAQAAQMIFGLYKSI